MAMNRSDVAYLITTEYKQNEYGVMEKTETRKMVFVNVTSVTSQEWFEGGRNGLNPQLRFTMFSYDYDGQEKIEYNRKIYTVYRNYLRQGDLIELYTELKKGNE